MNRELFSKINNLLSALQASNAVELVDHYYKVFSNPAPALVLDRRIKVLQDELDTFVKEE